MKKLLLLFAISTFLFSCRVTFAPQKSPEQIASVIEVQTATQNLYESMIISEDRTFDKFNPEYNSVGAKIDSIVAFNRDRSKGGNILEQSKLLQKYFNKYKMEHVKMKVLDPGQIRVYRDYLQSFIKPLLVSELDLK